MHDAHGEVSCFCEGLAARRSSSFQRRVAHRQRSIVRSSNLKTVLPERTVPGLRGLDSLELGEVADEHQGGLAAGGLPDAEQAFEYGRGNLADLIENHKVIRRHAQQRLVLWPEELKDCVHAVHVQVRVLLAAPAARAFSTATMTVVDFPLPAGPSTAKAESQLQSTVKDGSSVSPSPSSQSPVDAFAQYSAKATRCPMASTTCCCSRSNVICSDPKV